MDRGYELPPPRGYERRKSGVYVPGPWPAYRGPRLAGQDLVDWTIRLDGQPAVAPTYLYLASDITGSPGSYSWPARIGGASGTLTECGAGALAADQRSPFDCGVGDDEGVLGDGVNYFQAGNDTFGDIDTEDAVLALMWSPGDAGNRHGIEKGYYPGFVGYTLYTNAGSAIVDVHDEPLNISTVGTTPSGIAVAFATIDRSVTDGQRLYINGGAAIKNSGDLTTLSSLSIAQPLTIGANSAGASPFAGFIYAAAMWKRANWLGSTAELDELAKRFTYQCAGLWPALARRGAECPTVTRATASGHEVARSSDTRFWQVGAGLAVADDVGVPVYGAATNLAPGSNRLDSASYWTPVELAAQPTAGAKTLGHESACGIVADTDNEAHYVQSFAALGLSGSTQYTVSVVLEAGAQTWAEVQFYDGTTAWRLFVNLSTGAKGTTYGTPDATTVQSLGNNRYRVSITATVAASPASSRIYIFPAAGDDSRDFAGDGSTVDLYVWEDVQCETGPIPTPMIRTAGGSATRNALHIDRPAAALPTFPARCRVRWKWPTARTLDANAYLFCAHDGSADNRAEAWLAASTNVLTVRTRVGATDYDVTLTGDVADGSEHEALIDFLPGRTVVTLDGRQKAGNRHGATLPTLSGGWKEGRSYADGNFLNDGRLVSLDWVPLAA